MSEVEQGAEKANTETTINVEVAYALPEKQWLLKLSIKADSTVREAIEHSGILQQAAITMPDNEHVGIFGERVSLDTLLQAGDRVEIYRPLLVDPMENRRRRAQRQ